MYTNPFALLAHVALIASPVLALVVAVVLLRALLHRYTVRKGRVGSHYVTIAAPPEVDAADASGLWHHLGSVEGKAWKTWWCGQPHLIWEYRWTGHAFTIRVWVPSTIKVDLVVHALQAAWPGARANIEDATGPMGEGGECVGGQLAWHATATPVNVEGTTDPLRALVESGPAKQTTTTALVQIVAAPASRWQINRLRRSADGPNASPTFWSELVSIVRPRPSPATQIPESAWAREQRNALRKRLADQCWNVGIRWATTGPGAKSVLEGHTDGLGAAVQALVGPGHHRRRLTRGRTACNAWAGAGRTQVLNTAEVARLAHLPSDPIVPSLDRAGARPIAPVQAVPSGGFAAKVLGTAAVGGRKVALRAADARHHLHLIGKTGSGKSTLLQHLALADIRDRRGLVLIDPKGDLVDDLLDRLDPAEVKGRLFLIDPRQGRLPGLDPLDGANKDLVVDNLVGICRSIWQKFWGPRADDVLRYSLLTLIEAGEPFTRLPNLLISEKYRKGLLGNDEFEHQELPASGKLEEGDMTGLRAFWSWFNQLPPGIQSQTAGPVLSRMRALLSRPFARSLFGAPEYLLDLDAVLNKGGIVLARLPKGELGDDTARLIGSVLVAKVWQSATARASWPEAKRRDAVLMMDEAHNFLGLSNNIDEMLAEARAFHLSLVMAHQYVAQMPRELQFAVSSQARNKFYFPVGPEDAHVLARHTLPQMTEHDLAHMDDYTAATRLYVSGKELPAFTLQAAPPREPIGKAELIRAEAAEGLTPAPVSSTRDDGEGVNGSNKPQGATPRTSPEAPSRGQTRGQRHPDSAGGDREAGEAA